MPSLSGIKTQTSNGGSVRSSIWSCVAGMFKAYFQLAAVEDPNVAFENRSGTCSNFAWESSQPAYQLSSLCSQSCSMAQGLVSARATAHVLRTMSA